MGYLVTVESGGASWHRMLRDCPRANDLLAGAQQQFPILGSDPHLGAQLVGKFLEHANVAYGFLRETVCAKVGDDVDGVSTLTSESDTWTLSRLCGAANLSGVQFVRENSDSSELQRLCIYFRSQGNYPTGSDFPAGSLQVTLENFSERECLDFMLAVAGHAGWGSLREYGCHFSGPGTEFEGKLGEVFTSLIVTESPRNLAASRAPHRDSLG